VSRLLALGFFDKQEKEQNKNRKSIGKSGCSLNPTFFPILFFALHFSLLLLL
jgi:hypothetical protein